jgi:hypothetical protein
MFPAMNIKDLHKGHLLRKLWNGPMQHKWLCQPLHLVSLHNSMKPHGDIQYIYRSRNGTTYIKDAKSLWCNNKLNMVWGNLSLICSTGNVPPPSPPNSNLTYSPDIVLYHSSVHRRLVLLLQCLHVQSIPKLWAQYLSENLKSKVNIQTSYKKITLTTK